MILIPIIAKSLFIKDFALSEDNKATQDYYYREQCAIKELFGSKASIKFIINTNLKVINPNKTNILSNI